MFRITLIQTSPEHPPCSMAAYASLVSDAIGRMKDKEFEVKACDFFDPNGGGSMRRHHLWRIKNSRRFFAEHPSDLYHLLDGSMAGFLPPSVWEKTIITVHDLIPLLQIEKRLSGSPGWAARILIRRMKTVLKNAAGLAAVSEHTASDLQSAIGRSDVAVLHNPVRPLPTPADSMDLPDRYLFHVGNNADYKNRLGVLDVFERLQDIPDLHLVMAGPSPTAELRRSADRLDRVHFLENPSDTELSFLYKKATAFLFPSLYEGFGMPVLEAMQAGCPVVCSTAASLPEVVGTAALLASADDTEKLAACCRQLLMDEPLRNEMIQCGFNRVNCFTTDRFSMELNMWYNGSMTLDGVKG